MSAWLAYLFGVACGMVVCILLDMLMVRIQERTATDRGDTVKNTRVAGHTLRLENGTRKVTRMPRFAFSSRWLTHPAETFWSWRYHRRCGYHRPLAEQAAIARERAKGAPVIHFRRDEDGHWKRVDE